MRDAAFPALSVVFGLQLIRILVAGLSAAGVSTTTLALYGLYLFLIVLFISMVNRVPGPARSLGFTAGGLAVVRIAEQVSFSPAADLALATVGTALFVLFVPVYSVRTRGRRAREGGVLGLGLLLGFAVDTAIKGSLATLDLSWHDDAWAIWSVASLAGLDFALLSRVLSDDIRQSEQTGKATGMPLFVLGPVLVLELLFLQDIGLQTALTGWTQPSVFAWIMAANAGTIVLGAMAMAWKRSLTGPVAVLLAVALVVGVLHEPSGALAGGVILTGHLAVGLTVVLTGMALGVSIGRECQRGSRFDPLSPV